MTLCASLLQRWREHPPHLLSPQSWAPEPRPWLCLERWSMMPDDDAQAGVAWCLGHVVSTMHWHDLAATVQHDAKRALVNFFASALGSARHPDLTALAAVLEIFSGPREATVIGRGVRLDTLSAATLNAASANLLDYDETHLPTVIHPAAPVAPPVLALAERQRATSADVLLAFLLGVEVACRIGNAVSPQHYARGWHITATCGVFGAAAAVAGANCPRPRHGGESSGGCGGKSAEWGEK